MVGLQFTRGMWKRHFLENGKPFEEIIRPDDCYVVGPREARRFRIEGEGHVSMVSIEPTVLQEMSAGSPYRDPLELIRTRNGQDPILKGFLLQLQADLAAGLPEWNFVRRIPLRQNHRNDHPTLFARPNTP
jgi:hypothetical protein